MIATCDAELKSPHTSIGSGSARVHEAGASSKSTRCEITWWSRLPQMIGAWRSMTVPQSVRMASGMPCTVGLWPRR